MARPLLVRVGDLLAEPGSSRTVSRHVDLGELSGSVARTIPGLPVEVQIDLRSMAGGIEATGTVDFDWVGECRRCLDELDDRGRVELREIFQRDPVDEDVLPIDDDLVDLEPLVRELVLAGLPLAPLCAQDCPGPDPERFPTGPALEPAADEVPQPDPRWSALAELRFDG